MKNQKHQRKKKDRSCADRRRDNAQMARRRAKNPAIAAFFQLAAIFYALVAAMPLPPRSTLSLPASPVRSTARREFGPEFIPASSPALQKPNNERKVSARELAYRRMSTATLILEVARNDVAAVEWVLPILSKRIPAEIREWWHHVCERREWIDIRYIGMRRDASESRVAEMLMEAALPWYQDFYKRKGEADVDSAKAMILRLKANRRRPSDDGEDEEPPTPSKPSM